MKSSAQVDADDRRKPDRADRRPCRLAPKYPAPTFPRQHHPKPGEEWKIDGSKELVDYSMTKGGIHAFTRALSGNLVGKGIRVNAVAPGPVWTPLNPSEKEAEDVSKFGARTPMKRPAQPEEIAPAYVFLASPQCSSYITGEILPIIGGY
ncbi:Enoyl-(Acyl carrier protein) reductase [Mesorhizobium albiziae]|uniref:Enoyl-(Acyl carrier protein) reductase n=1 Tax=Neomesorhizobium albiziae TaxID=335020 RepID=A0A1I4CPW0_9HYPH|nr:hypothetical protein GCM10007937_26700 [Mesorhizobium albiziae]SFK83324.1 Enoyl-(Acyl carrier protein) reductase [Mesorhizobium albiziae]